jgi:hypothetical protein
VKEQQLRITGEKLPGSVLCLPRPALHKSIATTDRPLEATWGGLPSGQAYHSADSMEKKERDVTKNWQSILITYHS